MLCICMMFNEMCAWMWFGLNFWWNVCLNTVLSSSDGWADVSSLVATVQLVVTGELTSAAIVVGHHRSNGRPSLLCSPVAVDRWCQIAHHYCGANSEEQLMLERPSLLWVAVATSHWCQNAPSLLWRLVATALVPCAPIVAMGFWYHIVCRYCGW
jgi:hypothetical protein